MDDCDECPVTVTEELLLSKRSQRDHNSEYMRRGKWTIEEKAYAGRLISDFGKLNLGLFDGPEQQCSKALHLLTIITLDNGLLPLEEGATLRSFLAEVLNCDPMRITKKFSGTKSLGKVKQT